MYNPQSIHVPPFDSRIIILIALSEGSSSSTSTLSQPLHYFLLSLVFTACPTRRVEPHKYISALFIIIPSTAFLIPHSHPHHCLVSVTILIITLHIVYMKSAQLARTTGSTACRLLIIPLSWLHIATTFLPMHVIQ